MFAPGARVVTGQLIADTIPVPLNAVSLITKLVNVTLPVLVTTNEYEIGTPALPAVVGVTDFTNDNDGAGGIVTTAVDGGDVTGGPVGGVPVAVAVFVTNPACASACVNTYDAVHVVLAPGARVVTGHTIADNVPVPVNTLSLITRLDNVTFPVLVAKNE